MAAPDTWGGFLCFCQQNSFEGPVGSHATGAYLKALRY